VAAQAIGAAANNEPLRLSAGVHFSLGDLPGPADLFEQSLPHVSDDEPHSFPGAASCQPVKTLQQPDGVLKVGVSHDQLARVCASQKRKRSLECGLHQEGRVMCKVYLLCAAIASAILVSSWWQGITPVKVALLFLSFGIITFGNYWLMGVFRLYRYRPYILPDPALDNYVGEVLADFILVPFLASALLAHPKTRMWMVWLLSLVMLLLETLFVRLDLFVLQGWNHWYTALGFPLYYLALAFWVRHFEREGYARAHRAIILVSMLLCVWYTWGITTQRMMQLGTLLLWGMPRTESFRILSTGILYGFPILLSGSVGVWFCWFHKTAGSLLFAAGWIAWFYVLYFLELFTTPRPWVPFVEGAVVGLLIYGVSHVDRWFAARAAPRRRIRPWLPPAVHTENNQGESNRSEKGYRV
jgi:hypothetical protein